MARKGIDRGDGYISERTTKAGIVRYQARWQESGGWRSKTFTTRDNAEDHLRAVSRAKRDGRYEPESRMTVAQAIDGYLERGKRRWQANTWATYNTVVRIHIEPHIGYLRIVDLTPYRIQQWIDDLVRKGLSTAMLENARVIMNGACKDAMRLGVIRHNPVMGASLPARPKRAYSVWTAEQARSVLDECSADIRMHTYYVVALTTAMRPGEIRALKWADIHLDKARLVVKRTITRDERGRQVIGETTKTGRSRSIALPPSTVAALRSLRMNQTERRLAAHRWKDLDLVFDRGDGYQVAQNTIVRAHQRIAAAAQVPIIRMHDLRHTAATLLLESGVHVKIVADLLGHSSISITLDTYSHPDESLQRSATQSLADSLTKRA